MRRRRRVGRRLAALIAPGVRQPGRLGDLGGGGALGDGAAKLFGRGSALHGVCGKLTDRQVQPFQRLNVIHRAAMAEGGEGRQAAPRYTDSGGARVQQADTPLFHGKPIWAANSRRPPASR